MLSIFTMRQCSWLLILTLHPSSNYFILCRSDSALQDTRATPKSPKPCMRFKSSHRDTPGRHLGEAGVEHWAVLGNHGHWQQAVTMAGITGVLQQKCSLFPYSVRVLRINTFVWVLICCFWVGFFSEEQYCQWEEPGFPCFNFTIFELQETHNH